MNSKENDIVTIIPAQPGYHILSIIEEENGEPYGFYSVPIIAWRIKGWPRSTGDFSYTYIQEPIGDEDIKETAILRPDGTVFDGCDRYEDKAAALHAYVVEYRQRVKGAEESG